MKAKLILAALMLYGLSVHAQHESPFRQRVRFGLKAGVNASLFTDRVSPMDNPSDDLLYFTSFYRASGHGGVTADIELTKRLRFSLEALFNSRGMVYREKNDYVEIIDDNGNDVQAYNNFNYNINYMELPVTIHYNFSDPAVSNTLISAYVGLAPAVAMSHKTKLRYEKSIDGYGRKARNETLNLKNVNFFNNSALAGVQVGEGRRGRVAPFADLRFSYTLLPVFGRSVADNGDNLKTNMFTTSLSVGIKF